MCGASNLIWALRFQLGAAPAAMKSDILESSVLSYDQAKQTEPQFYSLDVKMGHPMLFAAGRRKAASTKILLHFDCSIWQNLKKRSCATHLRDSG